MSNQMITAIEIAEIMDCSPRYGYDIIKQLNKELECKGYIIRRGRVSRKYFYERTGLQQGGQAHAENNLPHLPES